MSGLAVAVDAGRQLLEPCLPVAVYGTLRTGQPNHRLLADGVAGRAAAQLADHGLYVDEGLPYVFPQPGQRVVAELLWLRAHRHAQLLAALDRLEGYDPHRRHNHYQRTLCTARRLDIGQHVDAWVYCGGQAVWERIDRRQVAPLASGDWLDLR